LTERAVSFGAQGRLTGVLTEPDASVRTDAHGPVLLLWNVGLNHHVGPYRFNVDLARHAAKSGLASLRFDLSGRGDSDVRRDPLGEMERALDDLREAMTLLTRRSGQERVIPVGFCSGVDTAHRLALIDERVSGVCFIEGYAYRTNGFYARYPLRLLQPARWRRALARNIPDPLRHLPLVRRLGRIPLSAAEDDLVYVRDYPLPSQVRDDYATMAAQGKRLFFVYVGNDSSYNHARQLMEFAGTPELEKHAEIEYYPHADHTFYLPDDRRRLVHRIGTWIDKTFGPPGPSTSPGRRL
jgi:dienelactone hydrolase